MSSLNARLKQYYEKKLLTDEKVDAVLAIARRTSKGPTISLRHLWAAAAAIVAALGLFHIATRSADRLTHDIVMEIALNHAKSGTAAIYSERYEDIQAGLDRLTFPILPDKPWILKNLALIGGKYCSIQGQLAAQIKMKHKASGKSCTLYITQLTDHLEQASARTEVLDDVMVEIWKKDNRLFVLASDI